MDLSIPQPLTEDVEQKLPNDINCASRDCTDLVVSGQRVSEEPVQSDETKSSDSSTDIETTHNLPNTTSISPAPAAVDAIQIVVHPPTPESTSKPVDNVTLSERSTVIKSPCRKRAREDDTINPSQTKIKIPEVVKGRDPLTDKDCNARLSIPDAHITKRIKVQRREHEGPKPAYTFAEDFTEMRTEEMEQFRLHVGSKSALWKAVLRVRSESCDEDTTYASKRYGPSIKYFTFKNEAAIYESLCKVPELEPHVPRYIGCDRVGMAILMEFIYGQSFAQRMKSLHQFLRVYIAENVKKIVHMLHRAGLTHRQVTAENVMIREGIETCTKEAFNRHIVLVGFSRALHKADMNEKEWEECCKYDCDMADALCKEVKRPRKPVFTRMIVPVERPYEKFNKLTNKDWVPEFPRAMPFRLWNQLRNKEWDDPQAAVETTTGHDENNEA